MNQRVVNSAAEAADRLIASFKAREARIGVIGLGYVGLPLVCRFAESGFRTIGFDVDAAKVQALRAGDSYLATVPSTLLRAALQQGLVPTSDYSLARDADALIICVPTPLTPTREPDLQYIVATMDALLPHLRRNQLLSLESTTYPGTTDEVLRPRIEAQGLVPGKDFFLVFSPEREDPGNSRYSTRTIPKICGGTTSDCLRVGVALYEQAIDTVVAVSSTRVAEMSKLLENIHRAVNIGLVNEMKVIADRMGIDIHEVIRAAATKPFGFVPYYPGPGLGGHCIPIDPFYLTWKAREYGVNTRFIELAGEINHAMPEWVVGKIAAALNARGKPVKDSRILVLGIAYKKNIDDVRESPAAVIMELLRDRGARLSYSDPHVPRFPRMREHRFDLASVPTTAELLREQDCVVLVTDHDKFDFEGILSHSSLIVDTRGRYSAARANVVKA
jgi:UDP-N-acetyl-D-glucosamine dehydrogenase